MTHLSECLPEALPYPHPHHRRAEVNPLRSPFGSVKQRVYMKFDSALNEDDKSMSSLDSNSLQEGKKGMTSVC